MWGRGVAGNVSLESIVREAHPEWEGRPIFEKAISACIMKRGEGIDP